MENVFSTFIQLREIVQRLHTHEDFHCDPTAVCHFSFASHELCSPKMWGTHDVLRTTQRLLTLATLLKDSRRVELLFIQDKRNSIEAMRDIIKR